MNKNKSRSIALPALLALSLAAVATVSCQREQAGSPESSAMTDSHAVAEPSRVTADEVKQWMADGDPFVVLDSRSEGAWEVDDTIAVGAVRVPPNDVASHLSDIPRGERILVYCT